ASAPNPTPTNECSVQPPMLQAAMPVDAVTATASSRSNTDLPVPADPVKNTFRPYRMTCSRTCRCSSESRIPSLVLSADIF
ncbi:MAG: hypothetical protein JOS17DRAFT_693002, partial [Linnemannia elongata]